VTHAITVEAAQALAEIDALLSAADTAVVRDEKVEVTVDVGEPFIWLQHGGVRHMLNVLLTEIASGKLGFEPENNSASSAAEFQGVVDVLRRLESEGLIDGLKL